MIKYTVENQQTGKIVSIHDTVGEAIHYMHAYELDYIKEGIPSKDIYKVEKVIKGF